MRRDHAGPFLTVNVVHALEHSRNWFCRWLMRKVNEKGYRSFLEAWLHGDGSFIGVIMIGVKSIFFRLLIFRLLTFPCGYS